MKDESDTKLKKKFRDVRLGASKGTRVLEKVSLSGLTLLVAVGCASVSDVKTPAPPVETPPPENATIWELPSEAHGTLRPDSAATYTVTDGRVLVTLAIPPSSVEGERPLTLRLTQRDAGDFLEFDPPLSLSRQANAIIKTRSNDVVLYPLSIRGNEYQPVRYEFQGATTSVWFGSSEGLWIGNESSVRQIAATMAPPADIDCETVLSLDFLGELRGYAELQQHIGYDADAPDIHAGIANRAAEEINRILDEDIPENACGYYFASFLELGRIVDTIGLVGASVDTERYKNRVETLLSQCPLTYLLDWEGEGVFPDGRMVVWSRDFLRGTLGTIHQTPYLLDMRLSETGGLFPVALDADARIDAALDLSEPLSPKAIIKIAAIKGKFTLFAGSEGGAYILDFNSDEGNFAFSMGLVGESPLVAGAGRIAGRHIQGSVTVAGLGVLNVYRPTDAEAIESYKFELRRESTITVNKTGDEGVFTMIGTLLIPDLKDVDFRTKIRCEVLSSPQ